MKRKKLRREFLKNFFGALALIFIASEFGSSYLERFLAWLRPHDPFPLGLDPHECVSLISNTLQVIIAALLLLCLFGIYWQKCEAIISEGILDIETEQGSQRLDTLLNLVQHSSSSDFQKYRYKIRDAIADFLYTEFGPSEQKKNLPKFFDNYFTQIESTLYPAVVKGLTESKRKILQEALFIFKEKMGDNALAHLLLSFLKIRLSPTKQLKSVLVLISPDVNTRIREIIARLPENEKELRQTEYDGFVFSEKE